MYASKLQWLQHGVSQNYFCKASVISVIGYMHANEGALLIAVAQYFSQICLKVKEDVFFSGRMTVVISRPQYCKSLAASKSGSFFLPE